MILHRIAMIALVGTMMLIGGNAYAQGGHGCCSGKKAVDKGHCSDKATDAPSISEAVVVTRSELVSLLEQGGVTVMDVRDAASFDAGHIDGAVLFDEGVLPVDKDARLVFYCGSSRCPKAGNAARKALELGYTNVMVFKDGWSGWTTS